MIQAGSLVRVNSARYGTFNTQMSDLIGTIQTVSSINGNQVHLTTNPGYIWSIDDFTLVNDSDVIITTQLAVGDTVRITRPFTGRPGWVGDMEQYIGSTARITSIGDGIYYLENNPYGWQAGSLERINPLTGRTNTLEVTAQMNPAELRTVLNEVNKPAVPDDAYPLLDGYYYKREVTYYDTNCIYKYSFYDKNHKLILLFNSMQYPVCCGISILYNFRGDGGSNFDASLETFFERTRSNWKPNIQFIAIKQAETEEVYDEDDNEYYDKPIGFSDDYEYPSAVAVLTRVLKPTLINSFINANSDNQCDIYQAVNTFRE